MEPSQLEVLAANRPNQSFVVRVCTSIACFSTGYFKGAVQ